MMEPEAHHHPLFRADGSASFSDHLYSVIAGVNGPVDVQRRDELPEEAAIEVNVRPLSGIGGPRERWFETLLADALRKVILVHLHPRTLIQITLQITKEPSAKLKSAVRDVVLVPTLLHAALLTLVDGRIPLATTACACLVALVEGEEEPVLQPNVEALQRCRSVHAFGYGLGGEMLVGHSAGIFHVEAWRKAGDVAKKVCEDAMKITGGDMPMTNGEGNALPWLRQTLEDVSNSSHAWKAAL